MTTTNDQAREDFRAIVARIDALTAAGDSAGSNREVAKLEALVSRQDDPRTFLLPLVADTEPDAVRFNAGSALLGLGHSDAGLEALDRLAEQDSSTASVKAEAVARDWRRRHP